MKDRQNRPSSGQISCCKTSLMTSVILSVLVSFGCTDAATMSSPSDAPVPTDVGEPQMPVVARLPVSLNSVMVAMVNQAADPIWVAAWRNPQSDADWRALQRRAVQLELAGTLLTVPGTGPLDEDWTRHPDWQKWSVRLRDAGADARSAVQARDIAQIAVAGDVIVEICEGCHYDFKLALPTAGEFGALSPTARDIETP